MSNTGKTNGFAVQTIAGALAAITAALLGSTLGVAGTVLGAGLASVVTTVAAALYRRSIQRVHATVTSRASVPDGPRTRRWPMLLGAGVLAFAVAIGAITGIEALTGHRISGGQGTSIGGIVRPHSGRDQVERVDRTGTSTAPGTTSTATTAAPTTTTAPPTTTTTSGASATTTTTSSQPGTSSAPPASTG